MVRPVGLIQAQARAAILLFRLGLRPGDGFLLRRHGLVAVITNETDHPMDLGRLNTFLATALAVF